MNKPAILAARVETFCTFALVYCALFAARTAAAWYSGRLDAANLQQRIFWLMAVVAIMAVITFFVLPARWLQRG